MRVLWSMESAAAGAAGNTYVAPVSGERVRLTLIAGGQRIAATTLRRRFLAPGERAVSLRVGETGFYGDLFLPAGRHGRRPGILLLGGSEGGLSTLPEAALLAAH